jgi:hypothetical protein
MIMSVSILVIGSGAATPVNFVNFSMSQTWISRRMGDLVWI